MGMLLFAEASAATAVGTFLNESNQLGTVNYPRQIRRIAVLGSAAAGDCGIRLFLGQSDLGLYYNTSAGASVAPVEAKDWIPVNWVAEANEPIRVMIADASGTNVMKVFVETAP